MNKNVLSNQVALLLTFSLLARLLAMYLIGDTEIENEWKILLHNLSEKGVLGFYVISENSVVIPKMAGKTDIVLPSVFMPPLYAYIIFIFKYFFSNFLNYVNLIIFFQIFLSTISCYLFYKIVNLKFSPNTSFLTSLIFSLFPLNIYASVQISSITVQIFLLIGFLYILKNFCLEKEISYKNLFFFSFLSGSLILLRGEFILFYILTLIYFFLLFSKKFKLIIISLIMTIMIISPYLIRNYYQFNTLTITKSFGYNLLKGNNPNFKVEGNADYISTHINKKNFSFPIDKKYEINLDNFYKNEAIEIIKSDPLIFIKNYFMKLISFMTIDFNSTYEKYYNFLHIVPKFILSITSLIGGVVALKKKGFFQYLSLYYFSSILFFSIFFILPRYSLILLPFQILLSLNCLNLLFKIR